MRQGSTDRTCNCFVPRAERKDRFMWEKTPIPQQPAVKQQLCYRETLVRWNPYSVKNLALCYEFSTGRQAQTIPILPDACLNVLFRLRGGSASAVVSGIAAQPLSLQLEPGTVYFGFKPYSAKGMRQLTLPWGALGEEQVLLSELLPCGDFLERLARADGFRQRVETVRRFALDQLTDSDYRPDFVEYAELKLCQTHGRLRAEELARYTGYTARHCQEKFKEAHGLSVKRYANLLRAQHAIRLMAGGRGLADVAFASGYFDQSHFNREFRLYTGDSPLHFQKTMLWTAQ